MPDSRRGGDHHVWLPPSRCVLGKGSFLVSEGPIAVFNGCYCLVLMAALHVDQAELAICAVYSVAKGSSLTERMVEVCRLKRGCHSLLSLVVQ